GLAGAGDHSPSLQSLRLMQVRGKSILRGGNTIEQHECTDLSPMSHSMSDHMHEHFFTRHAARGAVCKCEVDLLSKPVAIQRRYEVEVFPIARPQVCGQVFKCRHPVQVG